ncbi:MAG TPA: hypothetical protein VGF45_09805 [Polyangia bacterium]
MLIAALSTVGCQSSGGFTPLNRAALRASQPRTMLVRLWSAPNFGGSAAQWVFLPVGIGPSLVASFIVGNVGAMWTPKKFATLRI